MLCLCHYGPVLLRFWFLTNLGCEYSGGHLEIPAGKIFPCQGHALVTLYVQFLCDRWLHVENLCSILYLVYFDSWSWQSFVSTCDVFNCLFPLHVQNEIQLLSGVFCYSWLVCLLGFWLRNTSLVKVGNPISDGIVFVFHLAWRAWSNTAISGKTTHDATTELILSLLVVPSSSQTGIKVIHMDFSDPQGGKGVEDRLAATCKNHIWTYINAGNNVTTTAEMKEALLSYKGVEGF